MDTEMSRRYYVPQSRPGDPEFIKELMSGMYMMLANHDLAFEMKEAAPPRPNVRYWWFADTEGRGAIVVTDDYAMPPYGVPGRLLSVDGTKDFVDSTCKLVDKYVPFIPLSELQRAAREHGEEEPQMYVTLAAATGETSDPESLRIILEALRSPEESVRFAAVFAASLVSWEDLGQPLEELRREDPSGSARKLAENVLAARRKPE
jgi:hypothetical protein